MAEALRFAAMFHDDDADAKEYSPPRISMSGALCSA
jgi:hypothetical protein